MIASNSTQASYSSPIPPSLAKSQVELHMSVLVSKILNGEFVLRFSSAELTESAKEAISAEVAVSNSSVHKVAMSLLGSSSAAKVRVQELILEEWRKILESEEEPSPQESLYIRQCMADAHNAWILVIDEEPHSSDALQDKKQSHLVELLQLEIRIRHDCGLLQCDAAGSRLSLEEIKSSLILLGYFENEERASEHLQNLIVFDCTERLKNIHSLTKVQRIYLHEQTLSALRSLLNAIQAKLRDPHNGLTAKQVGQLITKQNLLQLEIGRLSLPK